MKRKLLFFIMLVTVSGLMIMPSCKTSDPTFGTLTITVVNPTTGEIIPNLQINLAGSLADLKAGVFLKSAWTDAGGKVYFGDLSPLDYYYGSQVYDDYGAVQVYAGNDFYVHYYPNTPHQGSR